MSKNILEDPEEPSKIPESEDSASPLYWIVKFFKEKNIDPIEFFMNSKFIKSYEIYSLISLIMQQSNMEAMFIFCRDVSAIQYSLNQYFETEKQKLLKDSKINNFDILYKILRDLPLPEDILEIVMFYLIPNSLIFSLERLISVSKSNPVKISFHNVAGFFSGDIPLNSSEVISWYLKMKKLSLTAGYFHKKLHIRCLEMQILNAIADQTKKDQIYVWQPIWKIYNVMDRYHQFVEDSYAAFNQYPITDEENWKRPIIGFLTQLQEWLNFSIFSDNMSAEEYISQVFQSSSINNDERNRYNRFIELIKSLFSNFNEFLLNEIRSVNWPAFISFKDQKKFPILIFYSENLDPEDRNDLIKQLSKLLNNSYKKMFEDEKSNGNHGILNQITAPENVQYKMCDSIASESNAANNISALQNLSLVTNLGHNSGSLGSEVAESGLKN